MESTGSDLFSRMQEARAITDAIFSHVVPTALYNRPVKERHRLIFYLGHLEAFDWNLFQAPLGLKSQEVELDRLFAFGIDPVGGGLPGDAASDWPELAQVQSYCKQARAQIDKRLHEVDSHLFEVAIEHRLMHAETLAYLLHNLAYDCKIPQECVSAYSTRAPTPYQVMIPEGLAQLGMKPQSAFGWDNEFGEHQVHVPQFMCDAFAVTNQQYLQFVQAGGYQEKAFWRPEDWQFISEDEIQHPHFWQLQADSRWYYRGMFGIAPLDPACPVYVTFAEALAFAAWAKKRLPTEAEWQRAAYGTHNEERRLYPWGDAVPDATRGNFHYKAWDPMPVDAHPAGRSAFGVSDLLGNGWEWTATPFGPLPGFEPFPFYPGYSANFFDGKHFVMKGGSARTHRSMLRSSFRNWFQPHYPHVYATFRCVEDV